MSISKAEQKLIENEMIFRRINEKAANDLDTLDAIHTENGDYDLINNKDLALQFKCECSDENCDERIRLNVSLYKTIHKERSTFVVKNNHQVDPIEKIIDQTAEYSIVVKNNTTPAPNDVLNDTAIHNA